MGDAHKKGIMKYIMKNPLDSQEARELAYQEYSDAHKDIYGQRPRNEHTYDIFMKGTVEEYQKELYFIWKEYEKL